MARAAGPSSVLLGKENLFYVGENISLVANLARAYGLGYARTVNLRQAISFIRQLDAEGCRLTGILVDMPLQGPEFRNFLGYLSGTAYANLPVVYVSTYLTPAEIADMSASHLVDDIVHPIRDIFTIGERLIFLAKVRQGHAAGAGSRRSVSTRVQEHMAAVVKRLADIAVALMLLILLAPLMMLIAVWIKADSRGPVFHNTYRAGRGYRVFKLYRFRTGKVGAARLVSSLSLSARFLDHGASFIKAPHKTGLTAAGKFLGRTGLADLPQLLNVLKGEMSIVGNRPLPLSEASLLTSDASAIRFNAPAGMTGLWQVNRKGHNENQRLRFDLAYARERSLRMDIGILLRSVGAVRTSMAGPYRKGL